MKMRSRRILNNVYEKVLELNCLNKVKKLSSEKLECELIGIMRMIESVI